MSFFGDYRIAERAALSVELSARRGDFLAVWQQQVGALGIWYDLSPGWRLQGALWTGRQFPSGARRGTAREREVRPYIALVGVRPLPFGIPLSWSDRWRVELRHREAEVADAAWRREWRVRRQDRFTYRLDERWSVAVMQEWMVAVPPHRRAVLEQTRSQAMLGLSVRPGLRVEAGYQLQRLVQRRPQERNHTVLLFVRHQARLR